MAKINVPAMPVVNTIIYDDLKGVDFSVDPSLVKKSRSPNAVNMISDDGGNPIKRLGWRVINKFSGRINGTFYTRLGDREYVVVHAGTELYSIDGKAVNKLKENIADKKSTSFHLPHAGTEPLVFDSKEQGITYPKTMTLAEGEYTVTLEGGVGRSNNGEDDKGGLLVFKVKIKASDNIVIDEISENGKGLKFTQNGKDVAIVGGGASSYIDPELTLVKNEKGGNVENSYVKITKCADSQSRLFILTGKELLSFDGENVVDLADEAYVPTIIISRNPTGGGTVYEPINLISSKRTESFLGTVADKDFQLTSLEIDSVNEVKVRNSKGDFEELKETEGYTVNKTLGKVSLTAAKLPIIAGQDNIQITYSKVVNGYADKIKRCTIATTYGVGGENRVFVSGNPELRSYDFWSELNKPSYFPDLNFATIGTPDTAIMGYQKIGDQLSIIKEDNQKDTTIFFRNGILNSKGEAVFSVKPSISGAGALSRDCFVNLFDEPLFLSSNGINATTSTLLNYEKILKNRSYFVDRKLTNENNLEKAIACEWKGYFLLCVNGNVYILDGRHKSGEKNGNSDFVYECYFWENVPAICWLSVKGELYFGTSDGRLCKFNTDVDNMTKYSDGGMLNDVGRVENGAAINAVWFTPSDDDGCVQFFKTLQKKGSLVTLSPYDRSSGEVCFIVDGNPEEFIRLEFMDIFNWEDIDFDRITFNSNESPQEIYFKKKKKKYKRLQIGIRNRQLDEGFGIHQIVKSFVVGGYSKNRGY